MEDTRSKSDHFYDVVIIGAGISGVDVAYRVQTQLPECTYTILEARKAIGGTWDLFRYPGVRSDSDLHTFGFMWRPWKSAVAMASGASIKKYIIESASAFGIDRHIQFQRKLTAANWDSSEQLWELTVDADGQKEKFHSRFLVMGTGYYDYHTPRQTIIPGIENFSGTVVHPQFWPEDLDFTRKKVVIIGSGATTITLLPHIAEKASSVTMLQRSPSYIVSRPTTDFLEGLVHNWLPGPVARKINRWKNILFTQMFFGYCKSFPLSARNWLRNITVKQLPLSIPHSPNFEPLYNPFEQRPGICPDGNFFAALRRGNAIVVTDTIDTMKADRIVLSSGKEIEADIVVTATGLKVLFAGGALISVDKEIVRPCEKFTWKGCMLQDLPNCFFVIGYSNLSWTLGADATALLICRILTKMKAKGFIRVVPRLGEEEKGRMRKKRFLDLSSTYVNEENAREQLPLAADSGPWRSRDNYLRDWWNSRFGEISKGLDYEKV